MSSATPTDKNQVQPRYRRFLAALGLSILDTADSDPTASPTLWSDSGTGKLSGKAGTAGSGTTAGGAGGAVAVVGGAGGAKTGTGAAAGGAGAAATLQGGAGGATASSGSDAGGAGAGVAITGGNGGAASAGTGNGGAGASITMTPGTGGTSAGGTAGRDGVILARGPLLRKVTRNTVANGGTVTVAQVRAGVIYQDASGGNVTMTLPTGTQLETEFPGLSTGDAIELFHASNHATNTSTLSGTTGTTLVGSGAVTSSGGRYLLIKTGTNTFDVVRCG